MQQLATLLPHSGDERAMNLRFASFLHSYTVQGRLLRPTVLSIPTSTKFLKIISTDIIEAYLLGDSRFSHAAINNCSKSPLTKTVGGGISYAYLKALINANFNKFFFCEKARF